MRINQISGNVNISSKGLFNSSKKILNSNKNKIIENDIKKTITVSEYFEKFGVKIQKVSKKISNTVIKILDTL